jgi:alpha-1,3-rhamnosyl/mannosyltransferase
MRHLGIDARKLADYGIGSYLQGLLGELAHLDPPGGLSVLVSSEGRHLVPHVPESWRLVEVEAPGYSVREQIAVPLAARRAGIEVLHVPHYVTPFLYPGRLVVTIHDIIHVLFPEFLPHALGFAYARLLIRWAVRRARRVVTVSETTASDLRRLFGASGDRLRVIPNGVHDSFFSPADAAGEEARRARLGVQPPYLLHVGNHKPHKNAESVLKAYHILFAQDDDGLPPLVLAGGFECGGTLWARAQAMGLGDRVRCVGHVEQDDLVALYRGATAFIYPTLYEGFGLPVLEAMASGVAVVAGDVAAVREVAGDVAVRVNPRDVVALAAAMRRILDHPQLRAELSQRGRRAAARYRWRQAAEATLAVYRAVQEEG